MLLNKPLIKPHRKNSKEVYFVYNGKEFCINKHNVLLKYSDTPEGRYFQYGGLEFSDYNEYNEVLKYLKLNLNRGL